MELTEEVKALLLNTAKELKGSARRMFMARTVQALGEGGQRLAERELGWNCGTMRKGMHEVEQRDGVRGCLLVAWPQAQRRPFAQLVERYHGHCGWAEPSRSAVSHNASVYAADGDGSASPVDRPKGLHG